MENGKIVKNIVGIMVLIGVFLALACAMTIKGFAFWETLGVISALGVAIAVLRKVAKVIARFAKSEHKRSF